MYWFVGYCTMHTGPDPIVLGLLVPSESCERLPTPGKMTNAEMDGAVGWMALVVEAWLMT